jgi:4,5-DOPA dioxygenase extradiol
MNTPQTARMPAVFFGHGSPMNAIEDNPYARAWERFGRETAKPRAILCVSAHWYTRGTAVTAMDRPRTIHDFGGFPQALFDMQYPAPGDPALAARVTELLAPIEVHADRAWGLDHGTWSVLAHVYPKADIPVVQLSIDGTQRAAYHYDLGRRLAPLRDEGVLIVGSGDTVHNLRTMHRGGGAPFDWAARFNDAMRDHILRGEHAPVIDYEKMAEAHLAVPTPEHFLPLLYVIGAQQSGEQAKVLTDGIDMGSVSMFSVAVGA